MRSGTKHTYCLVWTGLKPKLGEGRTEFVRMGSARLHRALDEFKSPEGVDTSSEDPVVTLPICWMAHRIVLKMFEDLELRIS